jgi:hypothetical protein
MLEFTPQEIQRDMAQHKSSLNYGVLADKRRPLIAP